MANIKYVWFCTETKLEVENADFEQYLTDNPLHHLVECARVDDPIVAGEPPRTVRLVPEQEEEAVQQVIDSIEGTNSIADSLFPLLFTDSAVSDNDWCQIGSVNDTNNGYVLPFDVDVVGMSIQWKRIKNGPQTLVIYVDDDAVYESPAQLESNSTGSWITDTLDIPVNVGQKIRIRGGSTSSGYFDKCIVNLIAKKV